MFCSLVRLSSNYLPARNRTLSDISCPPEIDALVLQTKCARIIDQRRFSLPSPCSVFAEKDGPGPSARSLTYPAGWFCCTWHYAQLTDSVSLVLLYILN